MSQITLTVSGMTEAEVRELFANPPAGVEVEFEVASEGPTSLDGFRHGVSASEDGIKVQNFAAE